WASLGRAMTPTFLTKAAMSLLTSARSVRPVVFRVTGSFCAMGAICGPALSLASPGAPRHRIVGRLTGSVFLTIEGIVEAVAQEVEAENDGDDGQARPDGHPRRFAHELARNIEHAAPGGCRRTLTQAEEGEAGFG